MSKLYIPAPGEEREHRVFLESLGVTLTLCAVLLFVFATQTLMFDAERQRRAQAKAPPKPAPQLLIARDMYRDKATLLAQEHAWTFEQLEAVFLFGDKDMAEAGCQALLERDAIALTPEQRDKLHVLLNGQLASRKPWAPTACFLRAHTNDQLKGKGPLEALGLDYWSKWLAYDDDAEVVADNLRRYRQSFQLPVTPQFFDWLRDCGLRYGLVNWLDCIQTLRAISPKEGEDLIDFLETHLSKRRPKDETALELVAALYADVMSKGYPDAWPPLPQRAYPGFGQDAQRTAAFQLCRMLNSPDREAVGAASRALNQGVGVRASPRTATQRWRETCQLVFVGQSQRPERVGSTQDPAPDQEPAQTPPGSPDDPSDQAPAPQAQAQGTSVDLLSVWSGRPEDAPDYTLAHAIARGVCQADLKPAWRCVGALWTHGDKPVNEVLREAFITTRYVEWGDAWEDSPIIHMARPVKTFPIKMHSIYESAQRAEAQDAQRAKLLDQPDQAPDQASDQRPDQAQGLDPGQTPAQAQPAQAPQPDQPPTTPP